MYFKVKGGETINIYGYDIQLPPLGYGVNVATGKLEKTDVLKSANKAVDQKWKITPLPATWTKKRKIEEARQEDEEDYVDSDLEDFRVQEWGRRLRGVWVYMAGVPVYLTGLHYFYLNWWKIDIGAPQYRDPDRKFFYVLAYCIADPRCCGLLEATKRRQGKTYRGGCFLYEDISRNKESEGGIQSKTSDDAKKVVFQKAVVIPFKKLPDFFRPVFDTAKGITPTTELRFSHTTKKGRRALEDLEKPELNSLIDWTSSEIFGYDGRKKRRIFEDEIGKTIDANVYERHQVVRYCLETDGEWTGFALKSTTVEEMESGGAEFKQLWDDSNPDKRDENGHTATGMYRYMTPAYDTLYYDDYGIADVEKAKTYFLNRREGLRHNPRALSSEIRKNPFNEIEMFRIDGQRCLYDAMKLNDQLDWLSCRENLTETGNFEWENGERFTKVAWKKMKNGRWEIPTAFHIEEKDANKVTKNSYGFVPANTTVFTMGCDPFKYDKVKDNRRSDCAALVYKKFDPTSSDALFTEAFVCMYKFRQATTGMQYEDLLKMAWYFGCQILFESNVDNWKDYFKVAKCEAFLMKLPGEQEYGIYADGHGKTHQLLADLTEDEIDKRVNKVMFKSLIEDWLEFDLGKTTEYDISMGAGYALIAARKKVYRATGETTREITEYFKVYKAI